MEACQRVDATVERFIDVFLTLDHRFAYIMVKNSFSYKNLKIVDGKLWSTKQSSEHGFGFQIIENTIKKAGGKVEYSADMEAGIFSVKVSILKIQKG